MTYKEIRVELGYRTIKEMIGLHGISEQNLSQIKKNNPKRYELIKIDMILKHHSINTRALLDMIVVYNKMQGVVTPTPRQEWKSEKCKNGM